MYLAFFLCRASFPLSDNDHQHTHGKTSVGVSSVFLECIPNKIFLENIFQRDPPVCFVSRNAVSQPPHVCRSKVGPETGSLLLAAILGFPCRDRLPCQ